MRKVFYYLEVIHRYVGLAVALFFLAIMTSGLILTVLNYTLPASTTPELRQSVLKLSPSEQAEKLEQIESIYSGKSITAVRLPYTSHAVYRVSPGLSEGERYSYFDQHNLSQIDYQPHDSAFHDFNADLHTSLLDPFGDGRLGRRMVGWIGLAGLIISVLGVIAWWPQRKGFKWSKSVAPKNFSWRELRMSHASSGIVMAVLVLLFSSTGWIIGDRAPARAVFTMFDGQPYPTRTPVPVPIQADKTPASLKDSTRTALETFPGAQIVEISMGSERRGTQGITYRMRKPGDMDAFGQYYVTVDPYSLQAVATQDGSQMGPGAKFIASSFTIHTGRGTPIWYQILIVIGSIIIAILSITGVMSWIQKHRLRLKNKRKKKRKSAQASI